MLTIEIEERIAASQTELWDVVRDVLRQREFVAYQIVEVRPLNVCDLGPDFRWKEHGVLLGRRYECECSIFAWEPPEWLCFGTKNLFHVSYELTPKRDGSTQINYRCELPQTPTSWYSDFDGLCRKSLLNLKSLVEQRRAKAAE